MNSIEEFVKSQMHKDAARHRSGVAMRFLRINRSRWDKPAREAGEWKTRERLPRRSSGERCPPSAEARWRMAIEIPWL